MKSFFLRLKKGDINNRNFEVIILIGYFTIIIWAIIRDILTKYLIFQEIISIILAFLFFSAIIPIVGWQFSKTCFRVKYLLKNTFFRKIKNKKELRIHYTSVLDIEVKYSSLFPYALYSFTGLIIMLMAAFILGYFIQQLTFITLLFFLFTFGSIHCFIFYFCEFKKWNCKLVDNHPKNLGKMNIDVQYIGKNTILIVLILFIPKILFLFHLGGIGVADTWQILSLASNIVYTGSISFLESMFGIFELIPSEKAVAAPLSLVIVSLFSGLSPLRFFFLYLLWFNFLGFIIFQHFISLIIPSINGNFSKKSIHNISFLASSVYILFPFIAIKSATYFSGRSLFLTFFPLFLILMWKWVDKKISNSIFILKGGILFFFLLTFHRISFLIILPLLFSCLIWRIGNRKFIKNLKIKKYLSQPYFLLFFLYFGILTFFLRFLLSLVISPNSLVEGWRKGTTAHLFLAKLPLIKEFLELLPIQQYNVVLYYLQTIITVTFWMGLIAPLFILDLILTPLLAYYLHRNKRIRSNFLVFYVLTKFSLLPIIFMLLVDSQVYFFLTAIILIIFHSIITFYFIFQYLLENRSHKWVTFFFKKFQNILIIDSKIKKQYFRIAIVILIIQSTLYINAFIVTEHMNKEEPNKEYITKEIIELSEYLGGFPELENATVINGPDFPYISYLGLRLSVLLPWINFIPSLPPLYNVYGYLNNFTYHFPNLPELLESIKNQEFNFLYYPGFGNNTEYYNLIDKIYTLFNGDISSNQTKKLIEYFNAKMILISRSSIIKQELPLLYKTAMELFDPIFENKDFILLRIT